jgi:hypothetical protein
MLNTVGDGVVVAQTPLPGSPRCSAEFSRATDRHDRWKRAAAEQPEESS